MRLKSRLVWVLLAVAAAVFFLHRGQPPARPPSPADELHIGQLTLQRCEVGANNSANVPSISGYCGSYAVPEDWSQPGARQIELRIALIDSDAATAAPDLVVFLDGGPGGAATEDFATLADAFAPLRQRRRILLVDQRGSGGSNSIDCPRAAARAKAVDARQPNLANSDPTALQAAVRDCLAEVSAHADPRHYTTTDAAHDLAALDIALGSPQLDLIGISYGTRLAQQYASTYPRSVRAIVLDSVVPNSLALGSQQARDLDDALKAQFALCAAAPECRARFGDVYASLNRLRDQLRKHPEGVDVRDPVSFAMAHRTVGADDLVDVVRLFAYSGATSALLPLTLDQALHGNYAPLLGQQQLLSDDLSGRLSGGLQLSVLCAEDADLLQESPADKATLLGNTLVRGIKTACGVWPRGSRPPDFHQPFSTGLPVLVLQGERDPVTPPRFGAEVVGHLTDARLITLRGQGHVQLVIGCVPRVVAQFIDTLKPRSLDTSCLDKLGDVPAFIDFNGAAP